MTNGEYGERAADSVHPGGQEWCDAPCFTECKRTGLCRERQPERGQRTRGVRVKSVVGVRFSQLTGSQRQAHPSPRLPRRATAADPLLETFQVPPGQGNSTLITFSSQKETEKGFGFTGISSGFTGIDGLARALVGIPLTPIERIGNEQSRFDRIALLQWPVYIAGFVIFYSLK